MDKRSSVKIPCATAGCGQAITLGRKQRKKTEICVGCERAPCTINGVYVRDAWVQARRDAYSHTTKKGSQSTHHMFCPGDCGGTVTADLLKKNPLARCFACSKERRSELLRQINHENCRKPMEGWVHRRLQDRGKGAVTLTAAQVARLLRFEKCTYCANPLNERRAYLAGEGSKAAQFDRVDNDKGYEHGNVVPCCSPCNARKGARYSGQEMLVYGLTLAGRWEDVVRVMRSSNFLEALRSIRDDSRCRALRSLADCLQMQE